MRLVTVDPDGTIGTENKDLHSMYGWEILHVGDIALWTPNDDGDYNMIASQLSRRPYLDYMGIVYVTGYDPSAAMPDRYYGVSPLTVMQRYRSTADRCCSIL